MVNEIIDLCDSCPVPYNLFFFMDILHHVGQPLVDSSDDVILTIVYFKKMHISRWGDCIDDCVFVNEQLQGR